MKLLCVIPARYASTRFPAKPLADIGGKSMIRRVYEQAKKCPEFSKVVVATDHTLIEKEVIDFGGDVCMTSTDHASGTDRCFEVLSKQQKQFDYLVNIQGDEPFIAPEQIQLLTTLLDGHTALASLKKKITNKEELFNTNVVKVITDLSSNAIYFSRVALPQMRNVAPDEWIDQGSFFKHIGLYAYRTDVLRQITSLPVSNLEKAESLEQLRWIENGFKIRIAETVHESIGIDTPEDLVKALKHLK